MAKDYEYINVDKDFISNVISDYQDNGWNVKFWYDSRRSYE